MKSTIWLSEFGAPAIDFVRRGFCRVWALLDGDDLYLNVYVCWAVSIIRHSGFHAQSRAWTHEFEIDLAETGSGMVGAGCNDTSQHHWQSLNEDWVFIVDS